MATLLGVKPRGKKPPVPVYALAADRELSVTEGKPHGKNLQWVTWEPPVEIN
jgi:hypothetical protein